MKKLLTILLSTLMVFTTFGNAVFAEEDPDLQDTNLTYEVTEGYEWSVPTKLEFTASNFIDVVATDDSGDASKIAISKCTLTADKTLLIEVDANQVFEIAESNGHTLDYAIKANDVSVGAGDVVLSLDSGEECEGVDSEIKGTLTKDVNEIAGDYSGTLTFLAEIVRGGKAIKVVADGTTATNVRFTAMPTNKQDALKADLKLAGTSSLSDAELADALVIDIDADTAGDVKMDISKLANEGDKVLVYHKSSTNGWELLGEVEVGADGTVTCSFTDYSPILVSKKGSSGGQASNPYAAKVASVQKLYDVGEKKLTSDDIVTVNGVDCYVLKVEDNKAELITKGIYDVRFDDGGHSSGDVMNYVGTIGKSTDKTYRYDYSTLKTWMDNFYTNQLGSDEYILNSNVTSYYKGSWSKELDDTFSTEALTQHVFALDAKEAKTNKSKFTWNYNYEDGYIDNPLSADAEGFWISAGYTNQGSPRAFYMDFEGNIEAHVVDYGCFGARPAFWITLN